MTAPGDWLAARLAEAPGSLRDSVERAAEHAAGSVQGAANDRQFADALKAAAEHLIVTAPPPPPRSPPPRGAALNLLTADALVTLACEWIAEQDPDSLGELR